MLETYSGATRVLAIVGDPIAQVKSPSGVTAALRAAGADAVVVPAHVRPADLAAWVQGASLQANLDGIIVTVPHKFAVLPLCQALTPRAASIGAVNLLRRRPEGGWLGDMCDGEGHVAGLRRAGCEPRGLRALLVGAGGAGGAIAHALVDAGVARLDLWDPDAQRLDALQQRLRRYGAVPVGTGSDDPAGYGLVVNATPLGMREADPLPLQVARLQPDTFVSDVVTVPAEPALMREARARGCRVMTGTGMFEAVRDGIVDFYLPVLPRRPGLAAAAGACAAGAAR